MEREQGLKCPECSGVAVPFSLDGRLMLNRCQVCGGIHFDRGELPRFLGFGSEALLQFLDNASAEPVEKQSCARCGEECRALRLLRQNEYGVLVCHACGGTWVPAGTLGVMQREKAQLSRRALPQPNSSKGSDDGFELKRQSDSLQLRATFVPVSMLLGYIATKVHLFFIFSFLLVIPLHELGHASAAWLAGRFALPIPYGFAFVGEERHLIFASILGTTWAWAAISAWKAKLLPIALFFVALLGLQTYATLVWTPDVFQKWMIFFGVGGEFVWSTLLISLFVHRLPKRLRWDFWRFPFVFVGAVVFMNSWMRWRDIAANRAEIPWGSVMGGNEAAGDMNKLRDAFNWSAQTITTNYNHLALGCLAVIALHFVVGLFVRRSRKA